MLQQPRTLTIALLLYASYALTFVLSLALFVIVVFFLMPPLLTADTPSRRVVVASVVTPVLMFICAAVGFLPEAVQQVRGRKPGDLTEAFTGAANAYISCMVLIVGLAIASLLMTIPVILFRLVFLR